MAKKVFMTRRETFAAAHRLFKPELSDKENLDLFGKCSNPNWHGHNYTLEVTVAGEIDKETGFVLDIKKLKEIMHQFVISKVDHKNLNLDTDFMKGIIPTSENITIAIWNQLVDKIPGGKLSSVKLYETENNYFEYKGE
ncbi:MAG: 6-carboxytetrahydropterin synthase [Ignavibacteriaceae bacterium]